MVAGRLLGWGAIVGLLFAAVPPALANLLPDAEVTQYEPDRIEEELESLEALGDGLVLTMAACEEQPHCITALSEHELARLILRIQSRVEYIDSIRAADDRELEAPYDAFREDYVVLRDRYAQYLQQVRQLALRINAEELEGDWEDILDFGLADSEPEDTGPQVPSPNDQLTLDRFQDANEPMPIE